MTFLIHLAIVFLLYAYGHTEDRNTSVYNLTVTFFNAF